MNWEIIREEYTDITRTNKLTYKCGVCGRSYNDIKSRMECEQACIKQQEKDAKRLAEEKKKAEQKTRHAEVTQAIDDACNLLNKYMKDYGRYNYDGKYLNTFDDILPSKFLHHFLF